MSNVTYYGPFKEHIKNYIELKLSIGNKYITEQGQLKRFDLFTFEKYKFATALTKEIVLLWCCKQPYETQSNRNKRTSIIRQLSIYLNNIGVEAYIMPQGHYPKSIKYMPYIFTDEELKKFFIETEKCHYCAEFPLRQKIMPVFFRMLYSCGLRVLEARLLKVCDVDLVNGILTINQAKKDNNRLVPMSNSVIKRCVEYSTVVHQYSSSEAYYFPALGGKPMNRGNVYTNFRKFLWSAGISHRGKGFGPRVHDFRHTFCVHCLKKWSQQGKDLMVYLPILRTYLGHSSFKETAYYLRLTADVFPDIILKLENFYPDLIPELEGCTNEAN